MPVPGSDELLGRDEVSVDVVEIGAVPVPGRVEFNPGYFDKDGDSVGARAVGEGVGLVPVPGSDVLRPG